MPSRAEALIQLLELQPHPEGGAYREIHRAEAQVQPADDRPPRSALTVIYFLLRAGEESRWHRVLSDEAWCWLEGDPLELFEAADPGDPSQRWRLGPVSAEQTPVRVVPRGAWQAARTTGAYTLVSCAVGPGFDFADFTLRPELPLPEG
jgi:predicted cupin superfamily sugar epimerase